MKYDFEEILSRISFVLLIGSIIACWVVLSLYLGDY